MVKLVDIEQGIHLSVTAFSREFSVTRETATKRIADAGLKPTSKRGGYPVYRLKELFKAVYQSVDGGVDPDRLDPFQRKAHYQAEHEKLQLETERGQLVPAIEAEARYAEQAKIMAECLETLPDILERDCGATPLFVAKIEKRLDTVRDELYRKLAGDAERTLRVGE